MKQLCIRNVPARKENEPHSLPVQLARRALRRAASIFALALPLVSLSCGGSGGGSADASVADHSRMEDRSTSRDGSVADQGNRDVVTGKDVPAACNDPRFPGYREDDETHDISYGQTQRYFIESSTSRARVEIDLVIANYIQQRVRLDVRGYNVDGTVFEENQIEIDTDRVTMISDRGTIWFGPHHAGNERDTLLNGASIRLNTVSRVSDTSACDNRCNASISALRLLPCD